MSIAVDTHVHLYDCYDIDLFFDSAFRNLAEHGGTVKAVLLAERSDCNHFARLKAEGIAGNYKFESIRSDCCLKVTGKSGDKMYMFAGRQVVTKERLEILSLLSDAVIEDGHSARDVIMAVKDAGGVPVLTWALGKWMFGRAGIVQAIIEQYKPGELLIGDSYMRPASCPEPFLMRLARNSGLTILAGTDPLPFSGEEKIAGCYASLLQTDIDFADPTGSLRSFLIAPKPAVRTVGFRGSAFSTVKRWVR